MIETMSDKPNNIDTGDLLLVQLIGCGDCDNYQTVEEWSGDPAACVEIFYEGGWRKVGDTVYCPDCSANKGIE